MKVSRKSPPQAIWTDGSALRAAAQSQEQDLKANFDVLEEEQLRIATLIEAQKSNEQTAGADLVATQQEAAAMADRAAQLKQQIETIPGCGGETRQSQAARRRTGKERPARAHTPPRW